MSCVVEVCFDIFLNRIQPECTNAITEEPYSNRNSWASWLVIMALLNMNAPSLCSSTSSTPYVSPSFPSATCFSRIDAQVMTWAHSEFPKFKLSLFKCLTFTMVDHSTCLFNINPYDYEKQWRRVIFPPLSFRSCGWIIWWLILCT